MNTAKKIIFKINGAEVDSADANDVDLQELDDLKITVALFYNVGVQDIEVVVEDVQVRDISTNAFISKDGLFFKPKKDYAVFVAIDSIKPTVDINTENGYHEFLDMIYKKDYDNALTFE